MSEVVYFKRGEQVEAANVKSELYNRLSKDGEWTRMEDTKDDEPQQAEAPLEVVEQEQAPEEASQAPETQSQVVEETTVEEPKKGKK